MPKKADFTPPGKGGTPPGLAKKNKIPPGHDPNRPYDDNEAPTTPPTPAPVGPPSPAPQPVIQEPVANTNPPENPNPTAG